MMEIPKRLWIGMMVLGASARLVLHPWNFTPMMAIGLFAGSQARRASTAVLATLLALVLSDAVLGFYRHMEFVYLSFALIVAIGILLRNNRRFIPILSATLAGSVLFFLLTNFGVWAFSGLYAKTLPGLMFCYLAAIPFFRNMVVGDLFYAAVLFGGFRLLEWAVPALREVPCGQPSLV